MRSFILEINFRLKHVERRVLRSTYVHKPSEPYFVEQSVVWFGVKNRTNHFLFYLFLFLFFCYGHLECHILRVRKHAYIQKTHRPSGSQKSFQNPGFGDRWADFDRDAHSSEDQSRPIRGSASLDPDLLYSVHLLCTCTVLPNDPM